MMGLSISAWLFGLLALTLGCLAIGFVLWPLWRQPAAGEHMLSRKDMNVTLYRERVNELRTAVANGEMTEDEAQLQEEEAGRHLLLDAQAESSVNPAPKRGGAWLFVLLVAMVPLAAILFYLQGDSWRLLSANAESPPWDFIIERTQNRLKANPEDVESRLFLARSYRALEKYQQSAQAYAELNRLLKSQAKNPNPDYLVEEGEMWALTEGGDLQGKPSDLFQAALKANPEHGRALWYAGLAALQAGRNQQAIDYWQNLAKQELPESFRHVLTRQLEKLGAEVPSGPVKPAAGAAHQPVIRLRVQLPLDAYRDLSPDTPVFIYAKAAGGPARPLAAQRLTLAQLPAEVVLTDAMQMAGGPALSDFDQWTVYARIALGGSAQAQTGDPFGKIELNRETALQGKALTINAEWDE